MALAGTPDWYVAELEDGASPWDLAHNKVAAQLGVAESDVLFAEPDLKQTIFRDGNELPRDGALAIGEQCEATAQDGTHGKALGPARFGWHLEDAFSGLKTARETVQFTAPRTRIAHVDTGYFPKHIATPAIIARELERNFVPDDENPGSAEDPDNRVLILDNSGHGTGTIGILAGKQIESENMILGGAPDAEIVPLRIADSVVLFRTSAFAEAIRYATAQHGRAALESLE
jgi:subtilisin family serine protease